MSLPYTWLIISCSLLYAWFIIKASDEKTVLLVAAVSLCGTKTKKVFFGIKEKVSQLSKLMRFILIYQRVSLIYRLIL